MNRERDFDQTLRSWLDDGADRAPERFVWAALEDVERTDQRGAWWALLEGTIMKLKPAAPILGVAAAVVLAIAAYQFLGGNVGGPPEPTPTPTPTIITSERLPTIMNGHATATTGWTVDSTTKVKGAVLGAPARGPARQTAFNLDGYVDGQYAEHTFRGPSKDGVGATWAALFDEAAHAKVALDIYLADIEAGAGWDLGEGEDAQLGDEGWVFTGESTAVFRAGGDEAIATQFYIWRVGNLLLAAVGMFEYDAVELRSLADAMNQRATD